MPEFAFRDMFDLGEDTTTYRKVTDNHVSQESFGGETVLKVEPAALTLLAAEAFRDISHLLRPSHLQQMRTILEDPEASANDKFVVHDLLKNACISAVASAFCSLVASHDGYSCSDE